MNSPPLEPMPDPSLRVGSAWRAGRWLLTAAGVLDIGSVRRLEHMVVSGLNAGAVDVVVDLAGVRICDAAGMTGLLRSGRTCTALGGSLRLAAPTAVLREAFAIVGLGQDVPMYTTVEAALGPDEDRRIKD
ncbi:STAS domain-containing protein [Dactylosporangium sp. NPDC051541]|uniref:STAS domain-containing protein n=1 Tax=Dactylosporangium sp. NPDC051541 TaxID=3363977 RepID=UPI0037931122